MSYETLLEQLPDYDVPDEVIKELEKFKGSSLRARAEKTDAAEKRSAELEAELALLKAGPIRENAFKEYGIDLDGLSLLEREALDKIEVPEGGLTKEMIGEIADKYELPMRSDAGEAGVNQEEKPAAADVVKHARANTGRAANTVMTPKEFATLGPERLRRAFDQHPEEYEALLRGETVTGIVFQ
jgi:hypothetical protein